VPPDSLRDRLEKSLTGAYRVERELGGGGMSRVFVAQEQRLGRPVVVKVLSMKLTGMPGSGALRPRGVVRWCIHRLRPPTETAEERPKERIRPSRCPSARSVHSLAQGLLAIRLIALLTGCASRVAPASSTGSLRVLVYNIHAGKTAAGVDNLAGVADLVRTTRADVVLLQEVDRGTRRSGNVDQPATLAASTGYHAAFGSALDYDGGKYGVAILSRWPIVAETLIHLPVSPPQRRAGGSYEPRGALRVSLSTPFGELTVLNTHIDPSLDDRWRLQEIETVARLTTDAERTEQLVVVGGDLNSTPESAVQEVMRRNGFRDSWSECGRGEGLTYPDDAPAKRIDYLYLTGAMRCSAARVVETRVSDHRPLLVELSVPATSSRRSERSERVRVPSGQSSVRRS
jgi:endonuclease/exonuclease/phosphatase family metal-dependent hydrolase